MQRIKSFFESQFFSSKFSLDYQIYMIFFLESYIISMPSAITNTMLQKGALGILLQWSYILFCTVLLFVKPAVRLALKKPQLLFITFFYIPFLYFQTAGYDGTALLFAPLGAFLLSIVFSGWQRIALVVLNILVYICCIYFNFLHPEWVTMHGGEQAKMVDAMVATAAALGGLAMMTARVTKAFEINNRELERLSTTDPLTGAYNRRYLTEFMERELTNCRRSGSSIYVMLMDLDHFKQINDTHGHGFGDEVLRSFSNMCQRISRKCDVFARYGGEEFVLVIFDVEEKEALAIAQRLREETENLPFRNNVKVTTSIGLARSRPTDTTESILSRADEHLYEAKQAGRNQVIYRV